MFWVLSHVVHLSGQCLLPPGSRPLYGCTTVCLPIRLHTGLGCFQFLTVWNKAAIFMSSSLCGHVFISLGYISGNRTAGRYDRCTSDVTRHRQAVFQSGHAPPAFPPAGMGVPAAPRRRHNILCLFYYSHPGGCVVAVTVTLHGPQVLKQF